MNPPRTPSTGLTGLRAFVAASSQGLGHATALALAQRGCHVTLNGRDPARLARAAEAIRARTGAAEVAVWPGDITVPRSAALLQAQQGDFDILVTNAPGPAPQAFEAIQPADWLRAFEANAAAMLALVGQMLPAMRKRGFGRIVNLLSTTALRPLSGLDASAAARAAVIAALRSPARAAAADGVSINHVLPGPIRTGRTEAHVAERAARQGTSPDAALGALIRNIPAGRLGLAEEVGALCAFLCSREAGFITGQSICIDGGLTL